MNTILVPTDFSTYGLNATRIAASLAKKTDTRIILQHNVSTLLEWNHLSDEEHMKYMELVQESILSETRLEQLTHDKDLKKLQVERIVTHGITYEQILQEARTVPINLIVLGSHGNEIPDRIFIGSNIQKVLREAPCPVLTVNREIENQQWKKLVVPLSFEGNFEKPFDKIKKLALDLNSRIYLLYVNTLAHHQDERIIRDRFNEFALQHPELDFESYIMNHEEVEQGILEYCREINADWIAMVSHTGNHKERYLLGITETVAFKSPIPLLSVRFNYN